LHVIADVHFIDPISFTLGVTVTKESVFHSAIILVIAG
jgi:hypothetical protein